MLIVGTAAQRQINLIQITKQLLVEIGKQCNESVLVRLRDGLESVCIARWDAPHAIRVHTQLGDRRPLTVGASGKLLLAHAPSDFQETVLSGQYQQFTPNSITKRKHLEKEIKKILLEGCSMSISEKLKDTVAVAAPIRDVTGSVIAAVSMTAPASRVPAQKLDDYAVLIKESARRISEALGYAAQQVPARAAQ